MIKYSIGIDISKNEFHVSLSTIDVKQHVKTIRSGSFKNNKTGFAEFIRWINTSCIQKDVPISILMEATGVYYENCALYLFLHKFSVSVILPNKSKKYMAALGIKTKNDKVDAKALSCMGAQQALAKWEPMGQFFYELRSITRHHQALKESKTVFNNQLEAVNHCMYPCNETKKSLTKMIKMVEDQIIVNEKAMENHLNSNDEVKEKIEKITEIKGVGVLTVAVILAETNGFELFESISQLISYAGYDVIENQSGTHTGKTKISKKGNSRIRRALHMPALCTVTHKVEIFKKLYDRTFEKHGIKMKSYVAIQKKLLSIIYTLWKKNEKFDENYKSKKDTTKDVEVVHCSRYSFAEAV